MGRMRLVLSRLLVVKGEAALQVKKSQQMAICHKAYTVQHAAVPDVERRT